MTVFIPQVHRPGEDAGVDFGNVSIVQHGQPVTCCLFPLAPRADSDRPRVDSRSAFGGHATNLAAISAALAAGPDAGANRDRRSIAGVTTGGVYLILGVLSTALTAVVLAGPQGVVQAVAGVALVGAFASACAGAMADEASRVPAAVTFVIAASGTTVAGIGAAFWALVVGIAVYAMLGIGRPSGTV